MISRYRGTKEMFSERPVLRLTGNILLALIAVVCLSYLIDLGWLRWKFAGHGKAFDRVVIRRYYAVPRKDRKEEYLEDDPHVETCVNSLYPHSAVSPCWYLNRHREQRVDM